MSPPHQPQPEDIPEFDVTWDADAKLWRGIPHWAGPEIQAPNLRALALKAMVKSVVHTWGAAS
jgi:hypothetical protein